MDKNQILSYFKKTIGFAEKVKSKVQKPILTSIIIGSGLAAFSLYSGTAIWLSLLPALIPLLFLIFVWKMLDDVVTVKDDITEICDCISSVKDLKDMKIEKDESGKAGFKSNIENIKKLTSIITDASTLKEAPTTLIDAASSIKSVGLVFNPLVIALSVLSFLSLWVFTFTAPFLLMF